MRIEGLPREVETVLLDFDGTLVDLRPKWWDPIESAFLEIKGKVPEEKLRDNVGRLMQDMPTKPTKFFLLSLMWNIARRGGLSRVDSIKFMKSARNQFQISRYINKPIPGVQEFLQLLDSEDIKIAIVTTASEEEMQSAVFDLPEIQNYPTITRNDVTELKPHPEPVLKALSVLNATADSAVMIGDFSSDIKAGKAAGAMTIGLSGFVPEVSLPGLQRAEPNLIVPFLADLQERIVI